MWIRYRVLNQQSVAQLHDIEYNGELNRAHHQGAKFALLLSMLEPKYALFRPHIAPDPKSN